MKKKRRVPAPERSALESARAALERAGEEPSEIRTPEPPAAETVDNAPLSAPAGADNAPPSVTNAVDNADAPATEAADDAPPSATNAADNTDAPATEAADNAETSVTNADSNAETSAPEIADNAETSATNAADNAPPSAPEAADDAETSVTNVADNAPPSATEAADNADASDSAEASEAAAPESVEAFAPMSATPDSAETSGATETTPETVAPQANENIPEPSVTDAADSAPEPDASAEEDDAPYADSEWETAEEPDAETVETETHTMETKEITVGYHRSTTDSAKTETAKKSKPRFNAFAQFKDALRGSPENREDAEEAPPSGSSRDVALRKRVMQIEDDETRNYLLDRVLPQMTWYSKRSADYQAAYYRLMAASIGLGALIPVCAIGGSHIFFKVALAILGASVTAINAYLALHKYQELWIAYRSTREELIHTLYSYFNQAGVFAQKKMSREELNVLLVEVCENTLSKENGGWSTTVLQKSS